MALVVACLKFDFPLVESHTTHPRFLLVEGEKLSADTFMRRARPDPPEDPLPVSKRGSLATLAIT